VRRYLSCPSAAPPSQKRNGAGRIDRNRVGVAAIVCKVNGAGCVTRAEIRQPSGGENETVIIVQGDTVTGDASAVNAFCGTAGAEPDAAAVLLLEGSRNRKAAAVELKELAVRVENNVDVAFILDCKLARIAQL
jgi:hypothetical protein